MAHLQVSRLVPASRFAVFDFLADPRQIPFLLDPIIDVQVDAEGFALERGSELKMTMTRFGLMQVVRIRIEDVLRGSRLCYRQTEGVFATWLHTMKFEEHDEKLTLVTDIVDYQLPFGLFGYLADDFLVKRDMRRMLEHRLDRLADHFQVAEAPRPDGV